jgi:peptide/nickel transport system substrate-binding protein
MNLFPLAAAAACITATLACNAPANTGSTNPRTEPKYGGVIKGLMDYDLTDMNPTGNLRDVICCLVPMAYNTLLGTEVGPNIGWEERNLAPELAEKWEVSPDAKTYTFHLRKGVKFANLPPVNGREMTSEDVALSFLYYSRTGRFKDAKPASRAGFMFEGMDRIDSPDPYTAVVRFKDSFAPFLSYVADDQIPIVPKELYDAPGGLADNAIGTGPFQVDKAATMSGSRLVFKKNPDYWETGKPYFDEFWNLIIDGDAPKEAAFITRQFDIFLPRSDSSAENIKQKYPQAKVSEALGSRYANMTMNSRIAPFNDVRIRKAFSLAIDRDEITTTLYAGKGQIALAGAPLGLFTEEEARQIVKYDPDTARRLVSEAGYPNGVEFEWLYPKEYGDLYESRAQLIQAQIKKANINMRLKSTTNADHNLKRATPDQHQLTATRIAVAPDIGAHLEQSFTPGVAGNAGGVNDPKVEAWIKAQRAEGDPAKRKQIIKDAVRYINGEMYWGFSLTYEPAIVLWQPDLMNFYPSAWHGLQGTPMANVWRDR